MHAKQPHRHRPDASLVAAFPAASPFQQAAQGGSSGADRDAEEGFVETEPEVRANPSSYGRRALPLRRGATE
jgi:hypothetical protein